MKQDRFVPQATLKNGHIDDLHARINATDNLEYAVLLSHVLLTDQLLDLLGLRLRTDTMPPREPNFEMLMGLALAGSRYERDRTSISKLNRARNTVAHKIDRSSFEQHVKVFTELEWVEMPTAGYGTFAWPVSEELRVRAFAWSFGSLALRIDAYHLEYQDSFPGA